MTRLHRSAALAAALAVTLAACSGGSDSSSTERDTASTDAVADAATTDGDDPVDDPRCAVIVGDGEYDPIDCNEPHDAESAGVVPAPATTDSVSLMSACASSVEALTGRPQIEFGIDVAASVLDGGDEIECWAESAAPGTLSASIRDDGLDAAIGEFAFITDLADGTCFRLADPAAFDLATVVDCATDESDIEMIYGQFEADDGPVPDDETVDAFFARCDAFEATSEVDVIGNATYIISPLADNWEALDRRTVLCVAWTDPDLESVDQPGEFDPSSAVGPVCANYDDAFSEYEQVPCDEPHSAEYAGSVTPPAGTLPDDGDDAAVLLRRLCRAPVEALIGRDLSRFGSGLGFLSVDGLGEPMVNDVHCFVSLDYDGALTGAISEIGYDAALDLDIISELEPGTCFVLVDPNAFDLGESAPCDAPDALMAIGTFLALDEYPPLAPYPGEDELRRLRTERCTDILLASGLEVDESTLSGTFPEAASWEAFDSREITCDAVPL